MISELTFRERRQALWVSGAVMSVGLLIARMMAYPEFTPYAAWSSFGRMRPRISHIRVSTNLSGLQQKQTSSLPAIH